MGIGFQEGRAGRLARVALLCCCALGVATALGGWRVFGQTPEQAVEERLEALRAPTPEAVERALTPELQGELSELGVDWRDVLSALYGHLSSANPVATMDGQDRATVELDVTNVDLAGVIGSYASATSALARGEAAGEGTVGAPALLALLEAGDAPTLTVHGSVALERVDGEWRLADPDALIRLALCEG